MHGPIDKLDVHRPSLASIITDPALVKPRFWDLNALKFVQKDFQISRDDNNFFDRMAIIFLADMLHDGQSSGTAVVGKALSDQDCPMGKIPEEVRADIGNQGPAEQPRSPCLISFRISVLITSRAPLY